MINLYIANLGKYNEGQLVGAWVALPVAKNELARILKEEVKINETYEERAIHDYESDIEGMEISEWADIWELNELAAILEKTDEYNKKIIESCLEVFGGEISDYVGKTDEYTLLEGVETDYDLGYYFIEEAGIYDLDSLGSLSNYIDYERFGRDLAYDFDGGFSRHGFIYRD